MSSPTPEQLFVRFLADGDETALDTLFRRCSPRLRSFALGLGLPRDRIDDLVHEALVTAVQRGAAYDASQPLLPWLKGILARKGASLMRDEARRQRHHTAWAREQTTVEPEPLDEVASGEVRELLRDAIAAAPVRYQIALELHLLEGLPPAAVAERLGRLQVTVRVHLHRGLQHVRANLPRGLFTLVLAMLCSRRAEASSRQAPCPTTQHLLSVAGVLAGVCTLLVVVFSAWPSDPAPLPPSLRAEAAPNSAPNKSVAPTGDERYAVVTTDTAAPPNPAPGFLVTVLDAAGQPVPQVGVCLEPACGEAALPARRRLVTDVRGEAHFSAVAWQQVRVRSDRGHDVQQMVVPPAPATAATCTLRCVGTPMLRGIAIDALGRRVPALSVWLASADDPAATGGPVTSTDAAGCFHLTAVAPGTLVAAFGAAGLCAPQPWQGEAQTMVLEVTPTGAVIGRVVDGEGQPMVDAPVIAGAAPEHTDEGFPGGVTACTLPTQLARTDAAGNFGPLWLPPGPHSVHVRARGHAPAVQVATIAAGATTRIDLVLARARPVHGRVLLTGGTPCATAEVVYRDVDRNHRIDVRSDPMGRFVLDVPVTSAGAVCARAPGQRPTRLLIAAYTDLPALELHLGPTRTVAGQLRFPDQSPVADFAVRWVSTAGSALEEPEQTTRTTATGRFAVLDTEDPAPRCAVRGRGDPVWHALPPDALQRLPDQWLATVPHEFTPSATLRGRCLGEHGAANANARVFLRCNTGTAWESARSDAEGRFTVSPLAPGTYFVFIESQDPRQPCIEASGIVLQNGQARDVELRAVAAGTLAFALRFADGTAPKRALVSIVGGEPSRRYSARLDAIGEQVLPPGDYRCFAMGDDFTWIDGQPFRITAGQTTVLSMVAEPAVRTTLALQGLHALGEVPCEVVLHQPAQGRVLGTFHLLPEALPSVMAFLPRGEFEVLVRPAGEATTFCGALQVDSLTPRHAAIAVPLRAR